MSIGGKGISIVTGAYGDQLVARYNGSIEIDSSHPVTGSYRRLYRPAQGPPVTRPLEPIPIGTTVRWTLPVGQIAASPKSLAGGLEEVAPVEGTPVPGAAQGTVKFFDGLTNAVSGQVAPDEWIGVGLEEGFVRSGEKRVVAPMPPEKNPGITRIFVHPSLYGSLIRKELFGVEVVPLPLEPGWLEAEGDRLESEAEKAREFLSKADLKETDLILLPLTVPRGLETSYRPADRKTPIVAISGVSLDEAIPQELATLAQIAKNTQGQVYRVGLEEWSGREVDSVKNLFSIGY